MRSTRWFGEWGSAHLSDESLLELHALLLAGEHAVAQRYLQHVRHCESCTTRLEAVRADAADLRRDVTTSLEAHITPARLDRQLDIIMRRLEGHSGRVLPFPRSGHRPAPTQPLRRWVAMAAACGLIVGLGAGRMFGSRTNPGATNWRPAQMASSVSTPAVPDETDEQMLVEIAAAVARSRTKEFRALDELTPRVADARARGPR